LIEVTVEAFVAFGIAGEKAAQNSNVKGPGSFKVVF